VNTIPLLIYLAAGLTYGAHFATRQVAVGRAASTLLAAGALTHTFVIGMQTMAAGHVPIAGTTQAISTFVWLLALAYLYMEMTTEERALGVFIVPLLVALQAIRAMHPVLEQRVPILESAWFGVHVASLLFAYASFALACMVGVTYVLLGRNELALFRSRFSAHTATGQLDWQPTVLDADGNTLLFDLRQRPARAPGSPPMSQ
jgi:ABC-type transport system involved in cytochrome c biogenesis permease subunit